MILGADGVAPWWAARQIVLNARAVPERFARGVSPIPVVVRLHWSDDGEEWVPTAANAWTVPLVLVELDDARSDVRGLWVPARDVRRRDI
ncbi:hypothetical protein [Georgenia faecalis]|uniref:hypothetical protein n=1 Tax=Georgenia faecalis TaxID=2483799 RepID=UPI000FD9E4CE|nr:hypothetical protein [Georgenia faecalis]